MHGAVKLPLNSEADPRAGRSHCVCVLGQLDVLALPAHEGKQHIFQHCRGVQERFQIK